jgi:hypothetical protein
MECIGSNTLNRLSSNNVPFCITVSYVCMLVKEITSSNNIRTHITRTRMFGPGPGRGRSISLVDIPGSSSTAAATTATTSEDGDHMTAERRSLSSSCVRDPGTAHDMEFGLGLLASDSPIGEHGEADDKLLDYDSDETATHQQLALQNQTDRSAMETESQCQKDTTAPADSKTSNVIFDAMYHQCRASRTSVQRDNLVSISPDSTFGKRISRKLSLSVASKITLVSKKLFTVPEYLKVMLLLTSR